MRNAIFAVRGRNVNPDSFNWKTFNANVHELKQTMLAIQEGFKAFIFWEARGIRLLGNVAALFLFQFMISFPTETIALLPMAVLIGLQLEYWSLTDPSPIATRLTAVQMFITLLCGLAPSGLIAHPPATQEKSSDGGQNEEGRASEEEEDSEEEDSDEGKYGSLAGRVGAKVVAVGQKAVDQGVKAGVTAASAGYAVGKATVEAGKTAARASLKVALDPTSLSPTNLAKKTAKVAGRVAFPVMTVKASLQDELDRLKREVDGQIFDAVSRSTQDEEDFSINPLASILGPIQKILIRTNFVLRGVRRVMKWDDPFLTFLLCTVLTAMSILLAWAGMIATVIPWGIVLEWIWRIAGVLFLGPHMYWVGVELRAQEAEFNAEAELFATADSKTRKAILAKHRKELLRNAADTLEGASNAVKIKVRNLAGYDEDEESEEEEDTDDGAKLTKTFLKQAKFYTLLSRPSMNKTELRDLCRPDANRSYADLLHAAEDRPADLSA